MLIWILVLNFPFTGIKIASAHFTQGECAQKIREIKPLFQSNPRMDCVSFFDKDMTEDQLKELK